MRKLFAALRQHDRLTIQARVALLVVACILPAWLLAAAVTYVSYKQERSNLTQRTLETTRGLMRVVERDLAANVAALQTLATSSQIDRRDFAAFYRQAKEVLGYTSGFTIVLTDASGQQVVNLLRPFGASLPRHGNPELLQQVLATAKPAVSDVYIGGVTKKPLVGIEVPVIRDGKALYGLALGMDPNHLGEVLSQQGLPREWVIGIFDRTGTIVARDRAAEQFVGRKASPALLQRMLQVQEEVLDVSPTLEGIRVMTAFSRSSLYGWAVAIGVPEAVLTADLRRDLALYSAGAGLLLLMGLGLATWIGRGIARPIQELTAPALAIGKGEAVSIPPLGLKEADRVRQALLDTQQLLHQRERERDVAEKAEHEMLLAKQVAEQANAAKAAFLSTVSHELRTPLNGILGFCRLLMNSKDVTAEQARHLDIINSSGEHLLHLINNILDLSKIESGRMALEEIDFDLHRLLHEIASLMQVQAAGKGLSFRMVISPGVSRYATADAVKLRQVLINLLGNAIKFTRTGGVSLRAETTPQEAAQRVRFEVEDTGPGIDEKDRSRIFAPFQQLTGPARSETGTGLGLHISKQLVELMGGELGLSSIPGKGTVFRFEVPLHTASPSAELAAKWTGARIIGLAPGQQSYRLLIAEDQPENRVLLHSLLEPLQFDLRDAVDGGEAVALAQQWRPHLIWMDICMPDIDGLEATRRIKAAGAQTKIVALTARAMAVERDEILAAGCDDFISKPYRDTEIFEALEKHLGVRFLYDEEQPSTAGEGQCSVTQLRELPPELIEELRYAAVLLDMRRCLELAAKVERIDVELGARLRRMTDELRFHELLAVLDAVTAGGSA
ncbi:MAG: response regulator [Betaproteobacteria bacterium]|nr:response regulator [Betaproteobacteria bacterium]